VSDIIKWFRTDEQKIVLREEYQRQRLALPDLRQVLHKDTSDSQHSERRHWSMPIKTLEQIAKSDPQRFVAAMIASTSKTITNMVCDLVGSDGKQSKPMTHEQITEAVNELKERGVSGPFNCVVTPDNYGQLIWAFRHLIDYNQLSVDERDEISHMMNMCPGTHGLHRGSWRGVGIYVAQRCARSFVFGQGAIHYSERRDEQSISTWLDLKPPVPIIDLGDMLLALGRAKDLEYHMIAHYWPSVSIANKDAIVFIHTENT